MKQLLTASRNFSWWGWYVLAGLAVGVSLLQTVLWPLGVFGVGFFLQGIRHTATWQKAVLGGILTWTIKTLCSVAWFWSTYPIDVLQLSLGYLELLLIGFYWLTTGLFAGVAGAFLGGSLFWIHQRFSLKGIVWATPALWLLTELLGSFSLSALMMGNGSSLNFVFTFGYTGYALAAQPWLIQLAQFGGVYILSLCVVGGGVWIWLVLQDFVLKKRHVHVTFAILLVLYGTTFVSPAPLETSGDTVVAIIDTDFGGREYQERPDREVYRRSQLEEALRAALVTKAAYVVMPEDSRLTDTGTTPEAAYNRFRFLYGDPEAIVIETGRMVNAEGVAHVRSIVYDGQNKRAHVADKQILVPQGEYMPNFYIYTLQVLGQQEAMETVKKNFIYEPGPAVSQADFPDFVPGVLFCYSSANPLGIKALTKERTVPFVVHPISHAWFNEPKTMWYQYDAMLKVQAVWNQLPIVSAGNLVAGVLYTKAGTIEYPTLVAEGESWRVSLIAW